MNGCRLHTQHHDGETMRDVTKKANRMLTFGNYYRHVVNYKSDSQKEAEAMCVLIGPPFMLIDAAGETDTI